MSGSKIVEDDPINILNEMTKMQGGCACATVKDGHVLILSVDMMKRLIAKAEEKNQEQVVVFVKRSDMANAS